MSVRVEDQSRDHVLSSRPASDVACGLSAEPVYPLAWKRGGGRAGAPGVVTPRRELRRRGAGEVDQTKVLSARLSLKLAGSGRTRRWCARPAGASDGGLDQHVQQPGGSSRRASSGAGASRTSPRATASTTDTPGGRRVATERTASGPTVDVSMSNWLGVSAEGRAVRAEYRLLQRLRDW